MKYTILGFLILMTVPAQGQLAIQGGTIFPVDGPMIEQGTVLIEGTQKSNPVAWNIRAVGSCPLII